MSLFTLPLLFESLTRVDVLDRLMELVTVEPPAGADLRSQFKFPHMACEVLTCEAAPLVAALTTPARLTQLWDMLAAPAPLHPLLGSFFLRLVTMLLRKARDELAAFLRADPAVARRLYAHLAVPAIKDVFVAMTEAYAYGEAGALKDFLLADLDVVNRLVAVFAPAAKTPEPVRGGWSFACLSPNPFPFYIA